MKRTLRHIIFGALALFCAAACEDTGETVLEPQDPRLISIVPGTGYSGCTAIISGQYFSEVPEENIVTVDGVEVPVVSAADNRLTLVMPEHELGDVLVGVTVNGREASTQLEFTYAELPELVLGVSGINPSSGYVGDEVVISGENFDLNPANDKVTFGGVEAKVLKATSSSLRVIAPENPRGKVEVKVAVGEKSAVTYFTYVELVVDSNFPVTGAEGVEVTLRGEGYSENPTDNQVSVNGIPVPVISATPTELVVVMPDCEEGTYQFTVTVGERTVTGGEFTYQGCWRVETVLGAPEGTAANVAGVGTGARLWYAQDIVPAKDGGYWITVRNKEHGVYRLTEDFSFSLVDSYDAVNKTGNETFKDTHPWGGGVDSKGTLYFTGKGKGKIFTCDQSGTVAEYAIDKAITNPMKILVDDADNLYVFARNGGAGKGEILKVKDNKVLETYAITEKVIYEMIAFSYDRKHIFVFGNNAYKILMLDLASGEFKTVAGTGVKPANAESYTDGEPGNPLTATIGASEGGVCAADGTLYFGDYVTCTVRAFRPDASGDYSKGTIETIAGSPFVKTPADGLSTAAKFAYPCGICLAPDGETIYMLDGTTNSTLRKIYYR